MRILISWINKLGDFKDGKAIKEGPNFSFHENFYNQDRHIILYSEPEQEIMALHLMTLINKNFKDHKAVTEFLHINDPIDVDEIKAKAMGFLAKFSKDEVDIFISPGTPSMQVSWYLCAIALKNKITLYQTREAKFSKTKKPEIKRVSIDYSDLGITAMIHHEQLGESEKEENYEITPSIRKTYDDAEKIARTDKITTLILGESGVGKEHLARYIHEHSPSRKDKSYEAINCSAMSDQILESRLFGYKKGSFTGADKDTNGLFKELDGGTIFLDEIGDISPFMQQSLLRVLQSGHISPIGEKSIEVDVRIIAATNRDLPKLCEEGKFRWDLYYRLSAITLELPALRARGKKDIKNLIEYFLTKKKKDLDKKHKLQIQDDAMDTMLNYSYPGNVRQLENIISQLYVFNERTVGIQDLPKQFFNDVHSTSNSWDYVEKEHIKKVLMEKRGNQRQTAIAIGWSINTLKDKIKKYEIVLDN